MQPVASAQKSREAPAQGHTVKGDWDGEDHNTPAQRLSCPRGSMLAPPASPAQLLRERSVGLSLVPALLMLAQQAARCPP